MSTTNHKYLSFSWHIKIHIETDTRFEPCSLIMAVHLHAALFREYSARTLSDAPQAL